MPVVVVIIIIVTVFAAIRAIVTFLKTLRKVRFPEHFPKGIGHDSRVGAAERTTVASRGC
jgi:hypothetical protein